MLQLACPVLEPHDVNPSCWLVTKRIMVRYASQLQHHDCGLLQMT